MAGTVSSSAGRPGGVGNQGQTNRDKIDKDKSKTASGGQAIARSDLAKLGQAGKPSLEQARSKIEATRDGNAGTTVQPNYTPGAVGAYPDANAAAVADMLSSAIPGLGLTNSVYKGAKALAGEADPLSASNMGPLGDLLGGDPGPQRGYQPDKFKGQANLSGIGDPGSASGSDPREIAGRAYGAGTLALTGDPTDATDGGTGGEYSDEIMLRDRRKPKLGAGTQMLLA